jgi:peptidoglycan/xylan/chitin deacetylase (PgdA/CDA1 family)
MNVLLRLYILCFGKLADRLMCTVSTNRGRDAAVPKVSVVIPTFNRKHLLARTLPVVLDQNFPAEQYEVVIVVDGSQDGTVEWLQQLRPACGLKIIWQGNHGQPAAINRGLQEARGHVILFLDDDIICDRSLLRHHARGHENAVAEGEKPWLLFGPVLWARENRDGLTAERIRKNCDEYFARLTPESGSCGWCFAMGNPNTSAVRSLLLSRGGFVEHLHRAHDVEFGFRHWKTGTRFQFLPQAVTYLIYEKSAADLTTEARREGKEGVQLCRIHPQYRRYSLVTKVMSNSSWRQSICTIIARLPGSQSLISTSVWLAERLWSAPAMRRPASRVAEACVVMAFLRGAIEEAGSWSALKREFGLRISILLYHDVGTKVPGSFHSLTISPKEFARQMRWLSRHGYKGVSARDWHNWCNEGEALPEKPVVITFDDAFLGIAQHALPVLTRCGFSATVFVVTGQIGRENAWDRLAGYKTQPLMTSAQIIEWEQKGIDFGAHTQSHPDLRTLSPGDLKKELEGSRKDLEKVIGKSVLAFAYPFGYLDSRIYASAQQNFQMAFTCVDGLNSIHTDPHLLRRTSMEPYYTFIDPAARLLFGMNPLQRFRMYLGLLARHVLHRRSSENTSPPTLSAGKVK